MLEVLAWDLKCLTCKQICEMFEVLTRLWNVWGVSNALKSVRCWQSLRMFEVLAKLWNTVGHHCWPPLLWNVGGAETATTLAPQLQVPLGNAKNRSGLRYWNKDARHGFHTELHNEADSDLLERRQQPLWILNGNCTHSVDVFKNYAPKFNKPC